MTRTKKIEDIRKAIMLAKTGEHNVPNEEERFTLADILLAMSKTGYGNTLLTAMIHKDGDFGILDVVWDLRKDNLNEQSDETIDFIHQIIGE